MSKEEIAKKEYLHIALMEVNNYVDFLLSKDIYLSAEDIKKCHEAYKDYVNDVRSRCGKCPLRTSAYHEAKEALKRLQK